MRRIFMRKVAFVAVLLVTALALMGCPSVTVPLQVTDNPIGSKTGTSGGTIILGLVGDANAGAGAAAQNAGITKIATVDTQVKLMVGFVMVTVTTTVTGE
jgi:hypothetical protein